MEINFQSRANMKAFQNASQIFYTTFVPFANENGICDNPKFSIQFSQTLKLKVKYFSANF